MTSPQAPVEKSQLCSVASLHNALQAYTKQQIPLKASYSATDLLMEDFTTFINNHYRGMESFGWCFNIAADIEKIMQSDYYKMNTRDAGYTPNCLLPKVQTTSTNRQIIRLCDMEALFQEEIWKNSPSVNDAVKRAIVTLHIKDPKPTSNGFYNRFCYYDEMMVMIREQALYLNQPVDEMDGEYVYNAKALLDRVLQELITDLPLEDRLHQKIQQLIKPNKSRQEEIEFMDLAFFYSPYVELMQKWLEDWPDEDIMDMCPNPENFFQIFENSNGKKFVLEEDIEFIVTHQADAHKKRFIKTRTVPEAFQMLCRNEETLEILTLPTATTRQSVIPLLCLNGQFAFSAVETFFTLFSRFIMRNGTFQKATRSEVGDFFDSLKDAFSDMKNVFYFGEEQYNTLVKTFEDFGNSVSHRPYDEIRFFSPAMFSQIWLEEQIRSCKLKKTFPNCMQYVHDAYHKFSSENDIKSSGGLFNVQYCISLCILPSLCKMCPFLATFLHNQNACSRIPGLECCNKVARNNTRHPQQEDSDSDEESASEDEPSCGNCSHATKRCHNAEKQLEAATKKIKASADNASSSVAQRTRSRKSSTRQ